MTISMRTGAAGLAAFVVALTLATPAALATVRPAGGIDVGLERDPGNSIVARGTTDMRGSGAFNGDFAPGTYAVSVSADALAKIFHDACRSKACKVTGKVSVNNGNAILIGLLLPAVQKLRIPVVIPKSPTGRTTIQVSFTVDIPDGQPAR